MACNPRSYHVVRGAIAASTDSSSLGREGKFPLQNPTLRRTQFVSFNNRQPKDSV